MLYTDKSEFERLAKSIEKMSAKKRRKEERIKKG